MRSDLLTLPRSLDDGVTNEESRTVAIIRPVLLGAAILLVSGLESFAAFDPFENAISQFAGYGISGAVAIVLAIVLWRKEKEKADMIRAWDAERLKINEARLTDFRDLMNQAGETNLVQEKIAVTMGERNTSVNNLAAAVQKNTEVLERIAQSFARFEGVLDQSFARFEGIIEKAYESNRELREAIREALLSCGIKTR